MQHDPLILAFDTSAAHCAAALVHGDRVLAALEEPMARGQAERLMGMLGDCLGAAGKDWSDLDAVAAGIGPGNFTGIRISVSAARGLALGLGIPAIGVTAFAACALQDGTPALVCLPAPRGTLYVQAITRGEPCSAARQIEANAPLLASEALTAVGPAAHLLRADPPEDWTGRTAPGIARVAVASWRAAASTADLSPATPLYIKPPDAAPARDAAPRILP